MDRSSEPPDSASARLRRECESLRSEAKQFRERLRDAIQEGPGGREQRSAGNSKQADCGQQVGGTSSLKLRPASTMAQNCERGINMSDYTTATGHDTTRVQIAEGNQVRYWCHSLGCTEAQLRESIQAVGDLS